MTIVFLTVGLFNTDKIKTVIAIRTTERVFSQDKVNLEDFDEHHLTTLTTEGLTSIFPESVDGDIHIDLIVCKRKSPTVEIKYHNFYLLGKGWETERACGDAVLVTEFIDLRTGDVTAVNAATILDFVGRPFIDDVIKKKAKEIAQERLIFGILGLDVNNDHEI